MSKYKLRCIPYTGDELCFEGCKQPAKFLLSRSNKLVPYCSNHYSKCPVHKLRVSQRLLKRYLDHPELRLKQVKDSKRIHNDPKVVEKKRQAMLKLHQNPIFRKRYWDSLHISPNKDEQKILNILNEVYPNQWKFNGWNKQNHPKDGFLKISRQYPDFVHASKKLIIEYFGPWHEKLRKLKDRYISPEETAEKRIKFHTDFGFKTLIVWSKDLVDLEHTKDKIKIFVEENLPTAEHLTKLIYTLSESKTPRKETRRADSRYAHVGRTGYRDSMGNRIRIKTIES